MTLLYTDLFKLLVAVILGGILGLEREFHEKPAGLRTNLLICLGATLFTILSLNIGTLYNQDPGRIAAQILTGVGFLGAGAILREGTKITGLTTAATIWLVAAIGMAVGYGYYWLSVGATGVSLLVQVFFTRFEYALGGIRGQETIHVRCEPNWEIIDRIHSLMEENRLHIIAKKVSKQEHKFYAMFVVAGPRNALNETNVKLLDMEGVSDVET